MYPDLIMTRPEGPPIVNEPLTRPCFLGPGGWHAALIQAVR